MGNMYRQGHDCRNSRHLTSQWQGSYLVFGGDGGRGAPEEGHHGQELHSESISVMPDLHTLDQPEGSGTLQTIELHDI